MKEIKDPTQNILSVPAAILIGSVIIALSILVSGGVIKLKDNSKTTANLATNEQNTVQDQTGKITDINPASLSIDDDPVLGDKNAALVLMEFSDFECPFCKRHYTNTFPQLKENYFDQGKVKMVYKDNPLDFHNPNATDQAMAATCARDQGGDSMYYKYHGEIYKRTKSNNGLDRAELPKIAADLGINVSTFNNCLDSGKYKAEVVKDLEDAQRAGISGTPTFIIGKFNSSGVLIFAKIQDVSNANSPGTLFKLFDKDENLVGYRISGAFPYSTFKDFIDSLL
jgi:protein-disulfide isomerase